MARITINGITLDPAAQAHELAAAMLDSPDASRSNYILVQTTEPLNRAQKDELNALGATILEYVPNNTYLCSYPPADQEHSVILTAQRKPSIIGKSATLPLWQRISDGLRGYPNRLFDGILRTQMLST